MLPTLILLYALDTGNIPTGCYIVAWVSTIIELIYKIANRTIKMKGGEK